jgi:hypothetical protein
MAKRSTDGTFRKETAPEEPTNRSIIARWVEEEALAQRLLGFSFALIAESIGRAARGEIPSAVPLPQLPFPANYSITLQGVYDAFKRSLARAPKLTREEWATLDGMRSEAALLSLQKKAHEGDPKAIDSMTRIRDHDAKINGCYAPIKLKLDAKTTLEQAKWEEDQSLMELIRAMPDSDARIFGLICSRAEQRLNAINGNVIESSVNRDPSLSVGHIVDTESPGQGAEENYIETQLPARVEDNDYNWFHGFLLKFLRNNPGIYTVDQIATLLLVSPKLTNRVLCSFERQRIVERLGSDRFRYKGEIF